MIETKSRSTYNLPLSTRGDARVWNPKEDLISITIYLYHDPESSDCLPALTFESTFTFHDGSHLFYCLAACLLSILLSIKLIK